MNTSRPPEIQLTARRERGVLETNGRSGARVCGGRVRKEGRAPLQQRHVLNRLLQPRPKPRAGCDARLPRGCCSTAAAQRRGLRALDPQIQPLCAGAGTGF